MQDAHYSWIVGSRPRCVHAPYRPSPLPSLRSNSRSVALAALLTLIAVGHGWMAASVSRIFSTTSDEIAHLTAGYAYWTTRDYRLQPENGNFPQRWAALPLVLKGGVAFPVTTEDAWQRADVWRVGHRFFHESGNDLPAMLAQGRAMIAVLSALLCLLVFFWTRDLFGTPAGFLALLLAAFSPSLLAHGGLATSDTAAALGFAAASLAWWRLLHRVTLGRLLLAGASLGLLALSKYSVVLFAPMALSTAGLRLTRPTALPVMVRRQQWLLAGWRRFVAIPLLGIIIATMAGGMIWAAYGFRYSAHPPESPPNVDFVQSWQSVLLKEKPHEPMLMADGRRVQSTDPEPGIVQRVVDWTRQHQLLPEAWLYGLAFVEKNARGRLAYFAGEYRMTGWRAFFPTAFVLKTTLPTLALITLGIIGLVSVPSSRRRAWLYRLTPLLVLLIIYWGFALQSRLNIGHRHLLPTYAACYVLAAGSLLLLRRRRAWGLLILALLLWHVRESLAIRPDYLAYFNPLAGGPAQAHRLFVDSSLDWGQDLPRLKQWLAAHRRPDEPVFLSYFGTGNPRHEGIEAIRVGDGYFDWESRRTPPPLRGGIYCISATMLRRVYTLVRGPWSAEYELNYHKLTTWLDHVRTLERGTPPTDIDGTPLEPEVVNARLFTLEQLLFGRLCHYLEQRPPEARAGYSILIYKLSDAEVKFSLYAPLNEVDAALQATRTK